MFEIFFVSPPLVLLNLMLFRRLLGHRVHNPFISPIICLFLNLFFVYGPFIGLVFVNDSEAQGYALLLGGPFFLAAAGLTVLGFLWQVLIVRRKIIKSPGNGTAEGLGLKTTIALVAGLFLMLIFWMEIPVATTLIYRKLYPYGVGNTKETQFGGAYTSLNINGQKAMWHEPDVKDVLQTPVRYKDINVCIWGRFEKSQRVTALRSIYEEAEVDDYDRFIWVDTAGLSVIPSCPNGKTECAGNRAYCGQFQVSGGIGFGDGGKYRLQLKAIAIKDGASQLDQPFMQLTHADGTPVKTFSKEKPGLVSDIITEAKYYTDKEVCVWGTYIDDAIKPHPALFDNWLYSLSLEKVDPKDRHLFALHLSLDKEKIPGICFSSQTGGLKACAGTVRACGMLKKITPTSMGNYTYQYLVVPNEYDVWRPQ